MHFTEIASSNFHQHLHENPYPGRGLVIGKSDYNHNWLLIYWIMGRSSNSRNRRFVDDAGVLRTVPIDHRKVTDSTLIIYEAMLELPKIYIVSNGEQTRTIYEALQKEISIQDALAKCEREPDAPNFTARISGILDLNGKNANLTLSILKANPIDPAYTDRYYYHPVIPEDGYGFGLTTYQGDGDPLPSFSGDPLLLPTQGSAEEILETYWDALNSENRVALAIKEVSSKGENSQIFFRNQY